ncbi:MAG: nucleoside kinase [Bacteroidaceae bacterium]|nr:nucleoside kinase [Bacteroidaceae bacterium]
MRDDITIRCINTGEQKKVPAGSSLYTIYQVFKPAKLGNVTNAKVNNVIEGLRYVAFNNKDVEFQDITYPSGMRTYTRSLFFVLSQAVQQVLPGEDVCIEAPVSNGYYCRLRPFRDIEESEIEAIQQRMDEIIRKNLPFKREVCPTQDAIKLFEERGMYSKVKLLETCHTLYSFYYTLDGQPDYYYGSLLMNTGQLKLYGLMRYNEGLLLRIPDPKNPTQLRPLIKQEKMLDVFREHHHWQEIMGVRTIGELNEACEQGLTYELINVSEALQEKKICHIAEEIQRHPEVRLVLISGPSSSGKTTFSKRLSVQLMTCGIKPFPFSMDQYFVDRDKTPRSENGDYDFESIDALNIPLLEEHLQDLFDGKEVELPKYNFQTGKSELSGKKVKLEEHTVIIMEGIHGLNPKLTENISDVIKYKIYVSALTTILLDNHNYIPTTDNRLLRRIVRDYKYRGYSAKDTIQRWPSVAEGEYKWIFPFQENADIMFNSALLFELAGLRNQALPLLEMVPEDVPEYSEAFRLRKFLRYIQPIQIDALPPTSLLREFLGGSTFHY